MLWKLQKKLLENKGVKPHKIVVIRPGIDVERFANPDPERREAWRRKLRTEEFSIIFCHIASMIPRKAHTISLQLVADCKRRGGQPLLIIIGDPLHGEYYESLMQRISDGGLKNNVRFTGWTSEIPEILSLSHFTLLPSEGEALGIVLMEGMAAGTPFIAREGEGGAELIEEYRQGFLYRPDNGIAELAEAVCSLREDESRYAASSRQCREIAFDDFSLKRFGERLSGMYAGACQVVC